MRGSAGRPRRPAEPAPEVPADVTSRDLDREVLRELASLARGAAEEVARHLVMAGELMDEDPKLAYEHAKAAVARAGRVAAVREAAGLTAYAAGQYAEALAHLRAARRLSGSDSNLPVIADCERGLGRPDRALALANSDAVAGLDRCARVEMRIVAAGARRDLGQLDAAILTLQGPDLDPSLRRPESVRLFYAYADALRAAGRHEQARAWFAAAAAADSSGETDAVDRLAELEGVVFLDGPEEEDAVADAETPEKPTSGAPS